MPVLMPSIILFGLLLLFDGAVQTHSAALTFTQHIVSDTADGARCVFAVDLDRDGDIDIISGSFRDNKVAWYQNDGAETFTTRVITTVESSIFEVIAIDVDGDGDLDLVTISAYSISWYENAGKQDFSPRTISSSVDYAWSGFAIDLDGDNDIDVLSASSDDDTIAWYENDGSKSFTTRIITETADYVRSVYAIDLDGDNDIDILSASVDDDTVAWYENDGSQSFTARTVGSTNSVNSVFAIDLDGDGDIDVLAASSVDDSVYWYENDGSQSFTAFTITTSAVGATSVRAVDLDDDGDIDVLCAAYLENTVYWFENDGDQEFTKHVVTSAAEFVVSIFTADVNGDGIIDVLTASTQDNTIAWYESTYQPTSQPTSLPTILIDITSDLAAELLFDGDIKDTSNHGNDATEVDGSVTFSTQSGRGGVFFDGDGVHLSLGVVEQGPVGTDERSYCYWVYQSTAAATAILGTGSETNPFDISMSTTTIEIDGGGASTTVFKSLSQSLWHFVCITFGDNAFTIFLGTETSEVTQFTQLAASLLSPTAGNEATLLGSNHISPSFFGFIDDFRMYKRKLNLEEVKLIQFATERLIAEPTSQPSIQPSSSPTDVFGGLIVELLFSSGQETSDTSGNGNNFDNTGTIFGSYDGRPSTAQFTDSSASMETTLAIPFTSNEISVCLWFSFVTRLSKEANTMFYIGDGSDMLFRFRETTIVLAASNTGVIAEANKWHFACVTYRGTSLNLYLGDEDTPMESKYVEEKVIDFDASITVNLGQHPGGGSGDSFEGYLDSFRLYERVLPLDRMEELRMYRMPTSQPSMQPSSLPSAFPSMHPSSQPTLQPFSRPSSLPSMQPTMQPSAVPSSWPSSQPSSQPSASPSMIPSAKPSNQPSAQPSALPSNIPSSVPSTQPSCSPSTSPSMQPTAQPSDQPTRMPSSFPSVQPSSQPTSAPSSAPSRQPSTQPSDFPTAQPSANPSLQPSHQASSSPSSQPSMQPSSQPSSFPTDQPTTNPSTQPSSVPSEQPSSPPSTQPTSQPSSLPSSIPSAQPSEQPTVRPSMQPSQQPSSQPSSHPSNQPTDIPSKQPTVYPTAQPTSLPSCQPSNDPSIQPTNEPTGQPSSSPSNQPSLQPSTQPSVQPSAQPSSIPSKQPSAHPTQQPSSTPTIQPTEQPSIQPTTVPSQQPTVSPSNQPSSQPTSQPTSQPSTRPSTQPSQQPYLSPSSQPTTQPVSLPSLQPSSQPTQQPSVAPSFQPSSQPSVQPSSFPSRQPTIEPSHQPSVQPSVQPSRQPSEQPSMQPTGTPSTQPSIQPSIQPSSQPSAQPSSYPSKQPSIQPSSLPSFQPSSQPSQLPSHQPSSQPSSQPSMQPTAAPSTQPSDGPSEQPSSQPTNQPSSQPSVQPSQRPSIQPSSMPTTQPSEQPTSVPSMQPSIQPSMQPSSQPSLQPSSQPSNKPSQQPTFQPTVRPSAQPSSQPTVQPTVQPSSLPSIQPTGSPSCQPSCQPSTQPTRNPTSQPTEAPTSQPTSQPSLQPSGEPTNQPSRQPSSQPSALPTKQPTYQPTKQPSTTPSTQPTGFPSQQPTTFPSQQPSTQPTTQPTICPSTQPSSQPSVIPSNQPSGQPSFLPTIQPSSQPTADPTNQPTSHPSSQPTVQPSTQPTRQPSEQPSSQPTDSPTVQPSRQPSNQPSSIPSSQPSTSPTSQPSDQPTKQPSMQPSTEPSSQPSNQPSIQPSCSPSVQPSGDPSNQPSGVPSCQPTSAPSSQPSTVPTIQPSACPSQQPSSSPSMQPSKQPTHQPTFVPSSQPTVSPSVQPSVQPTSSPSSQPSNLPTNQPTCQPTCQPTTQPSTDPTSQPTSQPSLQPTIQPSSLPSHQPSSQPSTQPTNQPSVLPSAQPSALPTEQPTVQPSMQPSRCPTVQPSKQPSSIPSNQPSSLPTSQPSTQPSYQPTAIPSRQPSMHPTSQPSDQPSSQPTAQPTAEPSTQPSSQPTVLPSVQPSQRPSSGPTAQPSTDPTSQPTMHPSSQPSVQPSIQPSIQPSTQPSEVPSRQPSSRPSSQPTSQPSIEPTAQPTTQPSGQPSPNPTQQPSTQPSSQPSHFPSGQPSDQPSKQPLSYPSIQPSVQPSSVPSSQPSVSPSLQPSIEPSTQPSMIPSLQPIKAPSSQPTSGPTSEPTIQPTMQPSNQPTEQPSSHPSSVPSTQPTEHPSSQPSSLPSSQPSAQPSTQPTSFPTRQPSEQPTTQPSEEPTGQPSSKPTSQPTAVPTREPSLQPSAQPSISPSMQPTMEPSHQPSAQPSGKPISQPTLQPSNQPSDQPTLQPQSLPTQQPSSYPSMQPSTLPTLQSTSRPSSDPTALPTMQPSQQPSSQPSEQPSCQPTSDPSSQPSQHPTLQPSGVPTVQPSKSPSLQPYSQPTLIPSAQPTKQPSTVPTCQPSIHPSNQPSTQPSLQLSACPTANPTSQPSNQPTNHPSSQPTQQPSPIPSGQPSKIPSSQPTVQPTSLPSLQPTDAPSSDPTQQPSSQPSVWPSVYPTSEPSCQPSSAPTPQPTTQPSGNPSQQPSIAPSVQPSITPSIQPSSHPTTQPSKQPSTQPTSFPSSTPSTQPSQQPSSLPSNLPTSFPSSQPSLQPNGAPSSQPTQQPSEHPSVQPSDQPTVNPSSQPTLQPSRPPSSQPTTYPSIQPSVQPSIHPSAQPSLLPSHQPTAQPSIIPSTQPTNQPSNLPSNQPSIQPSEAPSTQPSTQPSISPTMQPTIQPSEQPTIEPTAQPSAQPSGHPSAAPSSRPSNQPSTRPSNQPTAVPSEQPSIQPSMQPSVTPSVSPTQQPTVQPTGRPTQQPTQQPTRSPSQQPTGQPSITPSVQPTSIPTCQPTAQPSEQPSSRPSTQPSNAPSQQPSSAPTSQPSSCPSRQPSSVPSTQPTSKPTNPTSQPSTSPSCQPSSQPTKQPSIQPSRSPTQQPSMQPSVQPSSQPSNQPSSSPSRQPSCVPTVRPTSSEPTSEPSAYPTKFPITSLPSNPGDTNRPTSTPTLSPSVTLDDFDRQRAYIDYFGNSSALSNIANSVTFSSFYYKGLKVEGQCKDWRYFINTEVSLPFKFLRFTTIQAWYNIFDYAADSYTLASSTCTVQSSVTALLSALRTRSEAVFDCGGVQWRVLTCNRQSVVCINCKKTCVASEACPGQSFTVNPCQSSCSQRTAAGAILNFQYAVIPRYPAFALSPVVSAASTNSLTVSFKLATPGIVYCGALLEVSTSTTLLEVFEQGFSTEVSLAQSRSSISLVINQLMPDTDYVVLCYTESLQKDVMDQEVMLNTAVEATTGCCRSIEFTTTYSTLLQDATSPKQFAFQLSSIPRSEVTVSLSTVEYDCDISPSSQSASTAVVPSVFTFAAGEENTEGSFIVVGFAGCYAIQVTAVSDDTYNTTQAMIEVSVVDAASGSIAVPAPKISTAKFSNDGLKILITFNTGTSQPFGVAATGSLQFLCSKLLQFEGVQRATCKWLSARVLQSTLGVSSVLVPGDMLTVLGALVADECVVDAVAQCSQYLTLAESTVSINAPTTPQIPTVVMLSSSRVSFCDDIVIDATSSFGNGGRPWTLVDWSVAEVSEIKRLTADNITSLTAYLNANFPDPAFVVRIPNSELSISRSPTSLQFTLRLRNYLGSTAVSSAQIGISYSQTGDVPQLRVLGTQSAPFYRWQPLNLFAAADLSVCGNLSVEVPVQYDWFVYDGITADPSITTAALDPRFFRLDPYSLQAGRNYTFQAMLTVVTSNAVTLFVRNSVTVNVGRSKLVAVIAGGASRTVQAASSILLDASGSYNLDDDPTVDSQEDSSDYKYTWTCSVASFSNFGAACGSRFRSSTSALWTLSADSLLAGTYQLTVFVSNAAGQRATAAMKLRITAMTAPAVTIAQLGEKYNRGDKIIIQGAIAAPRESATAQWSSSSFTNFASTGIALTPLTSDVATGSTSFQLAIAPHTLLPGLQYTFSLSAAYSSSSNSVATASVVVLINEPPSGGRITLTPSVGTAITTVFEFTALQWTDDSEDYPLSYVLAYYTTDAAQKVVVKGASTVSYVNSTLAPGLAVNNYAVTGVANVSDTFGSWSVALDVTYSLPFSGNTQQLAVETNLRIANALLLLDSTSVNQAVDAALGTLNSVDCSSAASSCSAVNRKECSTVANRCGPCLDGFTGEVGHSNLPCAAVQVVRSIGQNCTVNVDCITSSCVDGVCGDVAKQCINDCSGSGSCTFQDFNGQSIDHCSVLNRFCRAVCVCDTGSFGRDCALAASEWQDLVELREELCEDVESLLATQDVTADVLQARALTISGALQDMQQVSDRALANCSNALIRTINAFPQLSCEGGVLDATLDAVSVVLEKGEQLPSALLSDLTDALTALMLGCQSISALDETPTTGSSSNVQILTSLIGAVGGQVLSGPQSAVDLIESSTNSYVVLAEDASKQFSSIGVMLIIFLRNVRKTSSTGLTTVLQNLGYNDTVSDGRRRLEHQSQTNVRRLQQSEVIGALPFGFSITIPNTSPASYYTTATSYADLYCEEREDDISSGSYTVRGECPNGDKVQVQCSPSKRGFFQVACPGSRSEPRCTTWNGAQYEVNTMCELVSFTAEETTCYCQQQTPQGSARRALQQSATADAVSSLEFSTVKVIVNDAAGEDFNQYADLLEVQQSNVIVSTLGAVAAIFVIGLLGLLYWDRNELVLINDLKKQKSHEVRTIEGFFKSVVPSELRLQPTVRWKQRLWKRVLLEHPWISTFAPYHKERGLRSAQWLAAMIKLLCYMAIATLLVFLVFPDDGHCQQFDSKATCEEEKNALSALLPATAAAACEWENKNDSCIFQRPEVSFHIVWLLVLITAVVAAPINAFISYCCSSVYLITKVLDTSQAAAGNDSMNLQDELQVDLPIQNILLRAARLHESNRSIDYCVPMVEASRLLSKMNTNYSLIARRELSVGRDQLLQLQASHTARRSRYAAHFATSAALSNDIERCRHRALRLQSLLQRLSNGNNASTKSSINQLVLDEVLMQCFIAELFHGFRRNIAEKRMMNLHRIRKLLLQPTAWDRIAVWGCLPAVALLAGFCVFRLSSLIGSRSTSLLLVVFFVGALSEALVLQPLLLLLKWILLPRFILRDVQRITRALQARFYYILFRRAGAVRDAHSLVQHFNAACRVARNYQQQLPVARFIACLNDFDVPHFDTVPVLSLPQQPRAASAALTAAASGALEFAALAFTAMPVAAQDALLEAMIALTIGAAALCFFTIFNASAIAFAAIFLFILLLLIACDRLLWSASNDSKQQKYQESVADDFYIVNAISSKKYGPANSPVASSAADSPAAATAFGFERKSSKVHAIEIALNGIDADAAEISSRINYSESSDVRSSVKQSSTTDMAAAISYTVGVSNLLVRNFSGSPMRKVVPADDSLSQLSSDEESKLSGFNNSSISRKKSATASVGSPSPSPSSSQQKQQRWRWQQPTSDRDLTPSQSSFKTRFSTAVDDHHRANPIESKSTDEFFKKAAVASQQRSMDSIMDELQQKPVLGSASSSSSLLSSRGAAVAAVAKTTDKVSSRLSNISDAADIAAAVAGNSGLSGKSSTLSRSFESDSHSKIVVNTVADNQEMKLSTVIDPTASPFIESPKKSQENEQQQQQQQRDRQPFQQREQRQLQQQLQREQERQEQQWYNEQMLQQQRRLAPLVRDAAVSQPSHKTRFSTAVEDAHFANPIESRSIEEFFKKTAASSQRSASQGELDAYRSRTQQPQQLDVAAQRSLASVSIAGNSRVDFPAGNSFNDSFLGTVRDYSAITGSTDASAAAASAAGINDRRVASGRFDGAVSLSSRAVPDAARDMSHSIGYAMSRQRQQRRRQQQAQPNRGPGESLQQQQLPADTDATTTSASSERYFNGGRWS